MGQVKSSHNAQLAIREDIIMAQNAVIVMALENNLTNVNTVMVAAKKPIFN